MSIKTLAKKMRARGRRKFLITRRPSRKKKRMNGG
jgi:hypothetical protein